MIEVKSLEKILVINRHYMMYLSRLKKEKHLVFWGQVVLERQQQ